MCKSFKSLINRNRVGKTKLFRIVWKANKNRRNYYLNRRIVKDDIKFNKSNSNKNQLKLKNRLR